MTHPLFDGLLPAMKSKVLITGAAGFIGSHLADSLLQDGIPVRCLTKPESDISHLAGSRSEIISGDVKDPASLAPAMEGVHTVYHLAAISRLDANVPDEEYYKTNVEGTRNVLESARRAGVKRVLYTSTIESVGTSKDGAPLTETTPPAPRNIYGKTKLEAEKLVLDYHRQYGMETFVVRPPMIYGPRELILCQRLFRIIQRGFYPIIGSGSALTEFCFVKNQVRGIRLTAENGKPGQVYFISDDRSYTIEEIVDAIASELGTPVVKPHIPVRLALLMGLTFEILSKLFRFYPFVIPQTGRPPFSRKTVEWTSESRLFCDISKARHELGYRPPYSLKEGIHQTVDWYKKKGYLK
ncbi:MAG: NAD-dependent epimerase/dehydratase family protein [Smithella sp.]